MTGTNALGIEGLHHVSLRVRDLERSLALYRDTLGFPVKLSFTLLDWRFVMLDAGNSGYIELVEVLRDVRPGDDEGVMWHLALRTRNLEAAFAAVRRAGYTITREITPLDLVNGVNGQPLRLRVAFFRGPDGEDVELIEDVGGQS